MVKVESSPKAYVREYIYGRKTHPTKNMSFGSLMADGLEKEEATGDLLLDFVIATLPKYELRDIAFEVDLKDGKDIIKLLAKPDSAKADYSEFIEYKTSVNRWTQKDADKSGQVTFYALCMWIKTGKIPKRIRLICVLTKKDENGKIVLKDEEEPIYLETKRTMLDLIKMSIRIKKAWAKINKLCEEELL